MKNEVMNPYLPSFEYIPDGEPHVFDGRIYIYGSHDRFNGAMFCLNDYISYSADIHDLSDWRYEGVIYRKVQDPRNQNIPADAPEPEPAYGLPHVPGRDDLNAPGIHALWAPDVVRGPDGRYYLYYCLDFLPEVGVAVCDTPAGQYEYLGFVHYPDGTVLGRREGDFISFDPGIFRDDDGSIYLYSGNAPIRPEMENGEKASVVMKLREDMLTIREEPHRLMPTVMDSKGTGFEGHEFFEASSIRKVGKRYYFVYSSVNSHELCYAVSDVPDRDYRFGGTLVDIGDIYLNGRTEKESLNCLGNTHGGIECIDGQWYVFYHRQTNRTNFSRQGCAEKIYFDAQGRIAQAEVTSCGLNDGPLTAEGLHPAYCCCRLQSENGAVFSSPKAMGEEYPYLTQDTADHEPDEKAAAEDRICAEQYIANMQDGSVAGYKYFKFEGIRHVSVTVRGKAEGTLKLTVARAKDEGAAEQECGSIGIPANSGEWQTIPGTVEIPDGVCALNFRFIGKGRLDFRTFEFSREIR